MFTDCDDWNERYLKNLVLKKRMQASDIVRNYGISHTKMYEMLKKYNLKTERGNSKKFITKRLLIDSYERGVLRQDLDDVFKCKKSLIGKVLKEIKSSYVYPKMNEKDFSHVLDDVVHMHHELKMSLVDIQNKIGVPRHNLRKLLDDNGVEYINWGHVHKHKLDAYGQDELKRLHHAEKITTTKIAEIVGIPLYAVQGYFNKHNIKIYDWTRKVQFIDELRDKEWLQQKHLVELLSCREIGELLGCSNSVVEKAMKKLGLITRKPTTITDERFNCRDSLYRMHVDEELSGLAISKIFQCSVGSVNRQLKKFGIGNISYKFLRSDIEKDLADHLKDLGHQVITSSRSLIYPKEIDIYLPELNIAFEFNGLYWHSTEMKPKEYHQEKTIGCLEKGVSLFHIWENEVIDDPDGLLEKIENLLDTNIIESKLESIDKVLTNITGMFIPRDTLPLAEMNKRFDVDFIDTHEECPLMSDKEFPINPACHLQITKTAA